MSWLAIGLVSLLSGLLGALGMGAGAVLLLYLRVFAGMEQLSAQGINLLFFLPIAGLSLFLHARNRLVEWKGAAWCVAAGIPGALAGVFLAGALNGAILSKLLAVLLLYVGIRELFTKKKKESASDSHKP